jgi:6-phosphofructokinase 1
MPDPILTLADRPVVVIFSGGDAPGMNACLRALTRLGINRHGVPMLVIRNGYKGLVDASREASTAEGLAALKRRIESTTGRYGLIDRNQQMILMDHGAVSAIVRIGGIITGSARCLDFHEPAVRAEAITLLKNLNARGLIVCGGNGSLAGAELIAKESGLRVVGIPATIDNDLNFTEMALGVDTALNTVANVVDNFKDTAKSHRRVMVLETMGRASGELARLAAVASGAEMVVTPKRPLTDADVRKLAETLATGMRQGRSHAIVLVAEGVNFEPEVSRNRAYVLADAFKAYFSETHDLADLEIRPSVLGHLQRGGDASPQDAILAARFADAAMRELLSDNGRSGVTALQHGRVTIVDYDAPDISDREALKADMDELHLILSSW